MRVFTFLTLTALILFGLLLVDHVQVDTLQAATEVYSAINSNTLWTKANSPYDLTGNVLINAGAALTIQPGVTINLNSHHIMVNGTLTAKGSVNDKIIFNDDQCKGQVIFTQYSDCWNQQTQSGSIIQYATLSGIGIGINSGSPAILNSNIDNTIGIAGGAPIISANSFVGVKHCIRYPSHAIYIDYDLASSGTAIITNNTISGGFDDACISITNGSPIIQRNLISDGTIGIDMAHLSASSIPTVENNTISFCNRGISIGPETAAIFTYNNLEDIANYTVYSWRTTNSFNAIDNWWGTTDSAVIDQKIYDFNDDFSLGKVTYTPFLAEANLQALPDLNGPVPTPVVTVAPSSVPTVHLQNPSATDNSPVSGGSFLFGLGLGWIGIATIALFVAVVVLLVFVVVFLRRRSTVAAAPR